MDVKNFTKRVRSAFALGLAVSALAVCAQNADAKWLGAVNCGTVTGRVVDTDSLQPIAGATHNDRENCFRHGRDRPWRVRVA